MAAKGDCIQGTGLCICHSQSIATICVDIRADCTFLLPLSPAIPTLPLIKPMTFPIKCLKNETILKHPSRLVFITTYKMLFQPVVIPLHQLPVTFYFAARR